MTTMRVVRYVGERRGSSEYKKALRDVRVRKIDLRPDAGNIAIDFLLDGAPFALPMSPLVRDLVDLATTVYIVDELSPRDRTADRWTRDIDATMPVRAPAAWRRAEPHLKAALTFLSGDRFRFDWSRTGAVPALRNHRASLPLDFDVVCLFSGGLDSFIGALRLLEAGRKVVLVGHQSDGITSSKQFEVLKDLTKRFAGRLVFVQAGIRRSPRRRPAYPLGKKREISHRTRSFLFLSLAVAVARAARIEEVVIPENGLIAINPPLNISRVGTLSTRTAHPRFVQELSEFFRAVGAFDGTIQNPFLYLSKTDVVALAGRRLGTRLRRTYSCSHLGRTVWAGQRDQHCGYCVPCLYRRAAFFEIGADDPADYYRDVFRRFDKLTDIERSDVVALLGFAQRVARMSTAQRAAVALAHGTTNPSRLAVMGPVEAEPTARWAEMLRRWSVGFLTMARANCPSRTRRKLGFLGRTS